MKKHEAVRAGPSRKRALLLPCAVLGLGFAPAPLLAVAKAFAEEARGPRRLRDRWRAVPGDGRFGYRAAACFLLWLGLCVLLGP